MAKSEKMRREARRTRRILLGAVVLLLMALGVFSIFITATGMVAGLMDDTDEKIYYAEFVTPLVLLDTLTFESLDKAPQNTLRQAAIWLALSKEDDSVFERDEYGALYLPTAVVDNWALTLYGPNYKLVHESFIDSGLEFRLDEVRQSYVIPITSQPINYIPEVFEINNDGDYKRLTVGYKLPAGSTLSNMSAESEPVKYLDYVLLRQGEGYFLHSIVESETKVEVSADGESTGEGAGTITDEVDTEAISEILDQALLEQEAGSANG